MNPLSPSLLTWIRQHPGRSKTKNSPHSSPGRLKLLPECSTTSVGSLRDPLGPFARTVKRPEPVARMTILNFSPTRGLPPNAHNSPASLLPSSALSGNLRGDPQVSPVGGERSDEDGLDVLGLSCVDAGAPVPAVQPEASTSGRIAAAKSRRGTRLADVSGDIHGALTIIVPLCAPPERVREHLASGYIQVGTAAASTTLASRPERRSDTRQGTAPLLVAE